MWSKIIELSKLPIFADGDFGRALYVIVLIVLIVGVLLFLKVAVHGTVRIVEKICDTITSIVTVNGQHYTEQLRITGGKNSR